MTIPLQIVPKRMPETEEFWRGVDRHKLLIPRCRDCQEFFFPPTIVCPKCTSRNVELVEANGNGTIYSYVISHRPHAAWSSGDRMSVALIELSEGPRLVSTVVDCKQGAGNLKLDMPVEVTFRALGDSTIFCFKPC